MLPQVKPGKRVLIVAEKPDEGTMIAATLGGVLIDGTELNMARLFNDAFAEKVKKHRRKGFFEGKDRDGVSYLITWGYGHLYELFQAKDYRADIKWNLTDFPFFPQEYRYKPMDDKKEQVNRLNKWMNDNEFDYIISATDPDREGEGIYALIYQGAKSRKPVKRLWLDDLTEEGISKALRSLRNYEEPYLVGLRNSQAARSIVDWTIGANFTVLCTRKFGPYDKDGKQQMLTIGRVQTATLAIVVNREKEILNFKPQISYAVEALFGAGSGDYKGTWKRDKEEQRFKSEAEAQKLVNGLKGNPAVIKSVNYEKKNEAPPLLFDITSIQAEASKRFRYSVQEVLDTVQELYEKQYVSYPRTDSRYLTTAVGKELPEVLRALPSHYSAIAATVMPAAGRPSKRVVDDSKVSAHYALIPTKQRPDMSRLTDMQRNIYDLIVRSLLAALSDSAEWGHTEIVTMIGSEPFVTTGKMLIKAGWREVYGAPADKEDLPTVSKGESVSVKALAPSRKETKPPKRFTDGTLVKAMENAGSYSEDDEAKETLKASGGIGTPATRTAIVTRLQTVGYMVQDKKTSILTPTEKAFQLIDQVPVDEVKSPDYTASIENMLSEIVEGKRTKEDVIRAVEDFIRRTAGIIKSAPGVSRPAGGLSSSTGHTVSGSSVGTKTAGGKAASGGKASTGSSSAAADLKCPQCGSPVVERDTFYGCTNWKNGCKVSINKEISGHKLTKTEVKQLLSKGTTSKKIKFKSAGGREYEDFIKMHGGRAVQGFRVSS